MYKMTGFPAARFKLRGRGVIRTNHYADLVVFNPDTINDRATFDNPRRMAQGVEHVLVNGKPIIFDGEAVAGATPGQYLQFGRE